MKTTLSTTFCGLRVALACSGLWFDLAPHLVNLRDHLRGQADLLVPAPQVRAVMQVLEQGARSASERRMVALG